jgi:hypothetical protein
MGESHDGSQRGIWTADARRVLGSVIAAVAVADLAYRMLAREPLRRALGIEPKHA